MQTYSNKATQSPFQPFLHRAIGTLHAYLLGSLFTLAEARVLYELSRNETFHGNPNCRQFKPGPGLSQPHPRRLCQETVNYARGLLKDARESFLSLTSRGKKEFVSIDEKAAAQAIALLKTACRRRPAKKLSAR